ncbi:MULTISPECIES: flavin-dependent dehydrogenase [unclassified Microcoleus]|uniref:NAD(P)/FAD-dependent oxidoreductase n=1 Tax=unclassified Microcoleus TaxID=2642155 RepID=UPI001DA98E63|nr:MULTISPECIES: flavin-dependent dehydrogenase [unclassified Microcoleus]MCC3418627.1 flavin-dependent dehydrogenase [Microcoleus sp. PH2017_07_MST_O_A]MCC3444398.1 flavin-dependent dehydrogenase [Microcoleus sp. PH2017_03_ELD_O_A]MCC3502926.1 flavin-dependent dehydrogenase [Microcoleus sp. PH2017_19_SFW_U_A]TAF91888.1 MAG: flavin-dependent dehydrogenase [Oscillatoriales cyanobacterium]MCC3410364.1 flavin-dependent dehydrogenase [Microcoleus sp. PH2017_02_FOX_O_A]
MQEILYLEVPTPDTAAVCTWLQQEFDPGIGEKIITPDGFRLLSNVTAAELVKSGSQNANLKPTFAYSNSENRNSRSTELSTFVWSVQRTTYLKVFRIEDAPAGERKFLETLNLAVRNKFPELYPQPPVIDLSKQSIFEALAPYYPLTVKYFKKMPKGEYDLQRVYWWEQRWREGTRNPQAPKQVVFLKKEEVRGKSEEGRGKREEGTVSVSDVGDSFKEEGRGEKKEGTVSVSDVGDTVYDLIYIGGALGVIHAAVMARLGYRVLLLERMPFGRMNREWNISRDEIQSLIDLGLFTAAEIETLIAREYKDGYNKFFDANNPTVAQAPVLHTPKVLNIALDGEKLLYLAGVKLTEAGGEIWDETEFVRADVEAKKVVVQASHLPTKADRTTSARLLVDAMGSASPIAWQLNGGRAFDSVCPTVGAAIDGGFEPGVWDSDYGDVLYSHGDISRGRQLIWELFPAAGGELTVYLFHYHQVHPENPGSLLELYEDFFAILPEYRRCDIDKLVWKKPTFGYIPGHFSSNSSDRAVAVDRLIAIGDAASLQSPLVFTGFGSLVRNLFRLTDLLDTALKHDLLSANHLNQIRAYQSNVSVTWLFSKGMMVPTGRSLPPQRINSILNTFFGILAGQELTVAETFIKDRVDWLTFNRLAIEAAGKNPSLLLWILDFVTLGDVWRWLGSYLTFTLLALASWLFGWLPSFARKVQPWLEPRYPGVWLWLLATSYALTYGMGKGKKEFSVDS